jgi:hypothetical protein
MKKLKVLGWLAVVFLCLSVTGDLLMNLAYGIKTDPIGWLKSLGVLFYVLSTVVGIALWKELLKKVN